MSDSLEMPARGSMMIELAIWGIVVAAGCAILGVVGWGVMWWLRRREAHEASERVARAIEDRIRRGAR